MESRSTSLGRQIVGMASSAIRKFKPIKHQKVEKQEYEPGTTRSNSLLQRTSFNGRQETSTIPAIVVKRSDS